MTKYRFSGKITLKNIDSEEDIRMRETIPKVKRIVIKIGTSSLIHKNGEINQTVINELVLVLTTLIKKGKEILLVSSGAIGIGMNTLKINTRPELFYEQQAIASIGQAKLITMYDRYFSNYNQKMSQILLTRDILEFSENRKNIIKTINTLLKMNIIPIINENDAIVKEKSIYSSNFQDNDQLSASITQLTESELLIILSDVNGFYSENPFLSTKAKLYNRVTEITEDLMKKTNGKSNKWGTGGMISKLKAAKKIMDLNGQMILASSRNPRIIFEILEGKEIGTLFKGEKNNGY